MRRLIVCIAMLLTYSACPSETKTAIEIKIDADPELRRVLKRVVVDVYGSDESTPAQTHSFKLTEEVAGSARFPFTFVVGRGVEQQIKVVARGFEADDDTKATVENKVVASFSDKQRRYLDVMLRGACRNIMQPCPELDRTCVAVLDSLNAKGSCGPVPEVETHVPNDLVVAGSPAPNTVGPVSCDTVQACVSSDYPCEDSSSYGFQCQGQFAQWPMPEALPGSKTVPSYTVEGPVVHDNVTGLIWQRELPETYPTCSAAVLKKGDTCSWTHAKAYCDQLNLAGRSWRLPSKIELESLLMEGKLPALDTTAFSDDDGLMEAHFWSASTDTSTKGQAWGTEFIWGNTGPFAGAKPGKVRCVSSVLTRAGTPKDRYEVDPEQDVVTDTATGLTWQAHVSDKVFTSQPAAVEYCRSLPGGFRLPGLKELLTTIDPTRFRPAVDPLLPSVPKEWMLHSSSPCSDAEGSTFVMSTNNGMAMSTVIQAHSQEQLRREGESIAFELHAWCVR